MFPFGRLAFASRFIIAVTTVAALSVTAESAERPLLERDVLPILTKNCMGCHGGLRKFGNLDLRTLPAMYRGGESGPAVIKGKSQESELWLRIASDEMPKGKDREKLSAKEKSIIKRWIDAGMPTLSERRQNVDTLLKGNKRHAAIEVAQAIDKHVNGFLSTAKLAPAPLAEDDEFLRRVYLDLVGRLPTADQSRAFLDNKKPNRRQTLIDELLARPEFGQQLGRTWRNWVCPPELPSDQNGGSQPHAQSREFGKWLGNKFAAGESWDRITRDILTVTGDISKNPQVIFFGLVGKDGRTTADGSSRAVASLFMGVQLQCARCHDDPYRDWSQQQHWSLATFFGRSQGDFKKIEAGKGPNEKPGQIKIPGNAFKNSGKVINAQFLDGKEFRAPNNNDLRVPFVDWLVAKNNPFFARAFANRMWFYFFSRGLVNPIDDFRKLNPPSHPGLIKLLASEFSASDYDIKHLIRCICNSEAYQRTSSWSSEGDDQARKALTLSFGRMPVRLMTADVLFDSLKQVYGDDKLDLRTEVKHSKVGMAAPVGDAWLEFQRRFGTNEEDPTDFTHGIAQMLTMINHPRLLQNSKLLDKYLKEHPKSDAKQVIDWLYLTTLSRHASDKEMTEALQYIRSVPKPETGYLGVLWTLVNRSEFLLVR